MSDKNKIYTEKHIMKLSFVGSVVFMLVEGLMAYLTNSHSILMDFVFDITDLIMIGPFLVLVPLLYKPVTERRPYGFSQVESLFLVIKYSVLLFVTFQLVVENVQSILHGGYEVDAGAIAVFEFCVFLGCLAMYLTLSYYSRKYESDTVRAELYIWKLDVISSIGVALAFFAQMTLQKTSLAWVAPYIDPMVAIVMSLFLIVEPIKMIGTSLKELVLFAPKKEIMDEIRMISEQRLVAYSYELTFLDVIQTGRKTWVELYISSETDKIKLSELHRIRDDIRNQLKKDFDQIYVELIPDIDQ
ncbi:MAG: cation diffusion facilitator family transporter [bacterium]|nr:cation diffusion facilitator family transporter [bacterium]